MTRQEFKQKCIELRKQNFTLTEMVKILQRSKTSIYFHIKKISKSNVLENKLHQIKKNTADKIRLPKGISLLNRHPINFSSWDAKLVDLFAHILFDGEINRWGIAYNNRSKVLLENFEKNMEFVYLYKPAKYLNKLTGVIRLGYHNVELSIFAKEKTSFLLKNILTFDKELQKSFLRAFFNDEGSIYFQINKKTRRIKGAQHNNDILFLIQDLLRVFNIESTVDTRFHEIIIGRRKNLEKFAEEINFAPGLCVNGNRSNSIWKKSLEKREILNMALKSYLV